ncbi:hypothetical protein N7491_005135 [Penicillium cf. griseofulvum]|uniref:Uncharacterized protein n=1 Tax=Penicillium cf. griseofulvum TaxID=2972120 RepID=A0A9W9M4U0_9EURO|nr:hypothetical protein N7472_007828 [Penicillium cf. griseofulvum]KAJ5434540.1 hypothetical protein N7491_005135 [Penicillium cf. griseofulvum]KAJ5452369.1 hypothetical protein N7445_000552 [Penicillium cf. griseofulvum]
MSCSSRILAQLGSRWHRVRAIAGLRSFRISHISSPSQNQPHERPIITHSRFRKFISIITKPLGHHGSPLFEHLLWE